MSTDQKTTEMSEAFMTFRNAVAEYPEDHVDLLMMLKATPSNPINAYIIEYAAAQGFNVNTQDIEAYTTACNDGNLELNELELNTINGGKG